MNKILFCFIFLFSSCALAPTEVDIVIAKRKKVKDLVIEVKELFQTTKIKNALKVINKPRGIFSDPNHYIFIFDKNGQMIAHTNQLLIGKSILNVVDVVDNNKFIVKEMIELVQKRGAGWYSYNWKKPNSQIAQKSSYIVGLDNLIIGCGYWID